MAGHDKYKKYQVYFFLYLAVVCELLIVIVERDEAEEGMLRQQEALKKFNSQMIIMLVQNLPIADASAETKVFVGDTRYFDIKIKNVSEKTNILNPKIVVNINDVPRDSVILSTKPILSKQDTLPSQNNLLIINDSVRNSPRASSQNTRSYRFRYTPKAEGLYTFTAMAGTNAIEIIRSDIGEYVQIGATQFKRVDVEAALDYWLKESKKNGLPIPYIASNGKQLLVEIMQNSNNVESEFRMDVVRKEMGDQLSLRPAKREVVTALDFPTEMPIYVQGPSPDKVNFIAPSDGQVPTPSKGDSNLVWKKTYSTPGSFPVTISARDNRGAGNLSVSNPGANFNVIVKKPYLVRLPKPSGAFAGEFFEMNINVHGLEEPRYKWTLEMEGRVVETGTTSIVKYKIPEDALGKTMRIRATYDNIVYKLYADSTAKELTTSDFMYKISKPMVRVGSLSFDNNGTYPIGSEFRFTTYRCGRCNTQNVRSIGRPEVRIEAETTDGRDILDNVNVSESQNAQGGSTSTVRFFLKGKVSKDGTDAVIRVRIGEFDRTFTVTLFPN